MVGKRRQSAQHYRAATFKLAAMLGRVPNVGDLTDENLHGLREWLSERGYSPYTIDNARWMLRSLWNHAHQEGLLATLPEGPRRPVNVPPSPIVEDISSALAIHRASVQREASRQNRRDPAGGLRKLLTKVFSRAARCPATRPEVKPPAPSRDPATLSIAEVAAAWRAATWYRGDELCNCNAALRPLEVFFGDDLATSFGPKSCCGHTSSGRPTRIAFRRARGCSGAGRRKGSPESRPYSPRSTIED